MFDQRLILLFLIHTIAASTDFIELTKQPYFVDKSEFIKTFFEECNKHVFITSPRGFCKTTNLQMLRLFAGIEVDSDYKPKHPSNTTASQIFQHLKIINHTDIVKTHMSQHPIIYLDLQSDGTIGNFTNKEKSVLFFNSKLYQSFESYKWLLNIPENVLSAEHKIHPRQVDFMRKLNQRNLQNQYDQKHRTRSLYELAHILYLYFRKGVLILIDNYDSVLNRSFRPRKHDVETFYVFMSTVLTQTFDTYHLVTSYGLITGTSGLVLPHVLGLSKAKHYSFLSDHRYTPYYGFTDPEAVSLFNKYNCSSGRKREIRKYYNGYKTRRKMVTIYNPRSMASFLANIDHPYALRSYWNITEEDNFLLSFSNEKVFRHLLENLSNNQSARFNQFETYSLMNFTIFFSKCDEHRYAATEVEILFSYFFDQGYISHGIDQPLGFIPNQIKPETVVHVFTTPNIETWQGVLKIASCKVEDDELRLSSDPRHQNVTELDSSTFPDFTHST